MRRGFTLIEVLISLLLFSFISISMMNLINQTTRDQEQFDRIIKKNRILKNVLKVIQTDFNLAYSSFNIHNLISKEYKKALFEINHDNYFKDYLELSDGSYFFTEPFPRTGVSGEKNFIIFTSSAQNKSDESQIIKIGYFIEDCPSSRQKDQITQCLVRKTSLIQGFEVSEFDEATLKQDFLLENIKDLNISYFSSIEKDWVEQFQSRLLKGYFYPHPFPLAIRLSIEWEDLPGEVISLSLPIYSSLISLKIEYEKPLALPILEDDRPSSKQKNEEEKDNKKTAWNKR